MRPFKGFPKPKGEGWELVAEFVLDDEAQRIVEDLKENAKINKEKIEIAVTGAYINPCSMCSWRNAVWMRRKK